MGLLAALLVAPLFLWQRVSASHFVPLEPDLPCLDAASSSTPSSSRVPSVSTCDGAQLKIIGFSASSVHQSCWRLVCLLGWARVVGAGLACALAGAGLAFAGAVLSEA